MLCYQVQLHNSGFFDVKELGKVSADIILSKQLHRNDWQLPLATVVTTVQ